MIWTYAIEEVAPHDRKDVAACISKATDAWSKALSNRVIFQPLSIHEDEETADITFRFGRIENQDWIAHHQKFAAASVITFRDSYASGEAASWAVTPWHRFLGSKQFCLLTSALHEIGHMLGFEGHVIPGAGCMEAKQDHRWTKPSNEDVRAVLSAMQTKDTRNHDTDTSTKKR